MTKVQIEKRDPFLTLSLSWEEALLYVGNVAQICFKVKSAAGVTNFLFESHCAMSIADEANEVQ